MRLVTFRDTHDATRTGAIAGERVVDLTQAIATLPLPPSIAERGLAAPISGMLRLL